MPSVSIPTVIAATAAGADMSAIGGAVGFATALGGAGITAGGIATAATVASGAISAIEAHKTGVAQKNEAVMKSRQAGLDAANKAISIRQNMLKALASQNAYAGQAGIGTGGGFGANVNRQITQNQNDLLGLSADTSAQQSLYAQQGDNALATGNIAAGKSLLDIPKSAGMFGQ